MNEDFVTFKQAKKLKELGFNWECNHYYYEHDKSFHVGFYQNFNDNRDGLEMVNGEIIRTSSVSAPTLAQVQKWLRENGIYLFVTMEESQYYWYIGKEFQIGNCDTYEQSLLSGIDKVLELLKQK